MKITWEFAVWRSMEKRNGGAMLRTWWSDSRPRSRLPTWFWAVATSRSSKSCPKVTEPATMLMHSLEDFDVGRRKQRGYDPTRQTASLQSAEGAPKKNQIAASSQTFRR